MESERGNVYEIWCMSVRRGNEEEIHDLVILSISFQVSHCVNFSLAIFQLAFLRKVSSEKRNPKQVVKEFRRSNRETFLPFFEVKFLRIFFPSSSRSWGKGNDGKMLFLVLSYQFRVLFFLFTSNEISTGDKERRNENVCFCLIWC